MDNKIVLTNEQLRQLIEGLADGLVKRIYGVANDDPRNDKMWECDREEDEVIGEHARLVALLDIYKKREEYEKCHLINKHIDKLNKIIKNL